MIKIFILSFCDHCNGEAYLPIDEAESFAGEKYIHYKHCPQCQGSGNQAKWASLQEFADLLDRVISFEPDYQELASYKPVSQLEDSRDAAGIWDLLCSQRDRLPLAA